MAHLKLNTSLPDSSRGFTLLEVLVALTVIAVALGALVKASSSETASTAYLKEKTIAHFVAMNAMNRLLLEKEWPSVGKSTDSTEMAKHEWYWQREVVKTPSDETRQVIFRVYRDEAMLDQATRLIGYVTNPEFLNAE